jgi:hypothetical protein
MCTTYNNHNISEQGMFDIKRRWSSSLLDHWCRFEQSPPHTAGSKRDENRTMVVRLRLARWGRKDLPFYRIVAADARAPRDGKHLEIVRFPTRSLSFLEPPRHGLMDAPLYSRSARSTRSPRATASRSCASTASACGIGSRSARSRRTAWRICWASPTCCRRRPRASTPRSACPRKTARPSKSPCRSTQRRKNAIQWHGS